MEETPILEQPVSMLMTTGELITAEPGDDLASLWQVFEDGSISHVPVLERGVTLVGVVSLVDLLKLRAALRLDQRALDEEAREADQPSAKDLRVRDVMTKNLETIRPTSSLRQAAQLFVSGDFHSLLVTATDGELLGILTSSDVIRSLLGELPRE